MYVTFYYCVMYYHIILQSCSLTLMVQVYSFWGVAKSSKYWTDHVTVFVPKSFMTVYVLWSLFGLSYLISLLGDCIEKKNWRQFISLILSEQYTMLACVHLLVFTPYSFH